MKAVVEALNAKMKNIGRAFRLLDPDQLVLRRQRHPVCHF